ncbi:MAG: magnesium transporter CorA family protein [Candidatus Gracilibacteria bacterium]|jgi:magnesium transporter|nr:magnesium transporter CorA family protein [Candidatus Gracilibacteria bacterium]
MNQIKFKNTIWLNLTSPTKDDLLKIQSRYRFHDLDIEDCISKHERSKIEIHDKHIFLIFKFPVFNKRTGLVEIEELNIFLGKNFVITAHEGKLKTLNKIFEESKSGLQKRRALFAEGTGKFLWELLKALFGDIFPMINKMSRELKKMETDVFESSVLKNQLKDILIFKRNLISLRSILMPQRSVIKTIEDIKVHFLPENLELFFDDILDKIEKLIETTGMLQELVESLRDTNETMLTHSLNNTIKILTVFSAVMMPLTFITGLFGMNFRLPLQESPIAFLFIIGGMGSLAIIMLLISKWKKWI